jgi:glycosyltransferase involved in cell wall biosynthesis
VEGVSIIIPAYNAERTIAECLQAAINLRWPGAVEIVVVNDGSVDRTAYITSSFTGVRPISVENGGGCTRN